MPHPACLRAFRRSVALEVFAGFIATLAVLVALAITAAGARAADSPYGRATPVDAAEQLLDFAEGRFPQLFPTREPSQIFGRFRFRYYPSLGTYVGVAIDTVAGDGLVEGGVYVLGGGLGDSPMMVGLLDQFITPVASPQVRITLELRVSAPRWPGPVYLRAGAAPITRAEMTRQDASCSPTGPGNHSCTIGVLRGQTVTLVANDQQAQIEFFNTPYSNRDFDPRGIRSQFDQFSAPCTAAPARGECTFTALADQTVAVDYKPLIWTRMNFIGLVNWEVLIDAPPNLNIGTDMRTETEAVHIHARLTPGLAECITADVAVACYDIVSKRGANFRFEALDPFGPPPLGSAGPLLFVGHENDCGNQPVCSLNGDRDQVVTMKWQYYRCPTGVSNPRFNFGAVDGNCVLVTPG